jgi:hypothetical protein
VNKAQTPAAIVNLSSAAGISGVGTDELFEGLCTLALRIDAPEIDPVLAGLLYRFTRRFDVRAAVLQRSDNHALWRGPTRRASALHPDQRVAVEFGTGTAGADEVVSRRKYSARWSAIRGLTS